MYEDNLIKLIENHEKKIKEMELNNSKLVEEVKGNDKKEEKYNFEQFEKSSKE